MIVRKKSSRNAGSGHDSSRSPSRLSAARGCGGAPLSENTYRRLVVGTSKREKNQWAPSSTPRTRFSLIAAPTDFLPSNGPDRTTRPQCRNPNFTRSDGYDFAPLFPYRRRRRIFLFSVHKFIKLFSSKREILITVPMRGH